MIRDITNDDLPEQRSNLASMVADVAPQPGLFALDLVTALNAAARVETTSFVKHRAKS